MRYFFFLIFICCLATSCKPPLPVYFDKPVGIKIQGFDTAIAGDYIPLKDAIDKGARDFFGKYMIKYDRIVAKDTVVSVEGARGSLSNKDVTNIFGLKRDSAGVGVNKINCDSIFNTFSSFNGTFATRISFAGLGQKDRPEPVAGIIKITYDRIMFITIDSAGNNRRDTILSLNTDILLTRYSGKYFLNIKTTYGWEIMQLDIWENKFLSVRPFYFTSYDGCSNDLVELTSSTKNIYPNLKPILNEQRKVIGFKGNLDAKVLLAKFKESEESVLLLKIK